MYFSHFYKYYNILYIGCRNELTIMSFVWATPRTSAAQAPKAVAQEAAAQKAVAQHRARDRRPSALRLLRKRLRRLLAQTWCEVRLNLIEPERRIIKLVRVCSLFLYEINKWINQ